MRFLRLGGYRLTEMADSWGALHAERGVGDSGSRRAIINEHAKQLLLAEVFATHGIKYVVDVGAHAGSFAFMVRRAGFTGPIASFEPLPDLHGLLAERASRDPRWTIYPFAVGSREEARELYVARDRVFSSLHERNALSEQQFGISSSVERITMVPVKRLDGVLQSVLQGMQVPDGSVLLKSDTQGNDLDVLESASGILHYIGGIMVEIAVRPIYEGVASIADTLQRYSAMGFSPVDFYPVTQNAALGTIEFDCILLRTESAGAGLQSDAAPPCG